MLKSRSVYANTSTWCLGGVGVRDIGMLIRRGERVYTLPQLNLHTPHHSCPTSPPRLPPPNCTLALPTPPLLPTLSTSTSTTTTTTTSRASPPSPQKLPDLSLSLYQLHSSHCITRLRAGSCVVRGREQSKQGGCLRGCGCCCRSWCCMCLWWLLLG